MGEDSSNTLKRPRMEGMLTRKSNIGLVRSILVSALVGIAFKVGYIDRKEAKYRNFYA